MSSNIQLRRVFNPLRGDYNNHEVEINLLERGEAEFHYGNGVLQLKAPACFAAFSDESLYMKEIQNMSVLQLRFSADFLSPSLLQLDEAFVLKQFFAALEDGVYIEDLKEIGEMRRKMVAVSDANGVEAIIRLYELVALLGSNTSLEYFSSFKVLKKSKPVDTVVARVDAYMMEHLNEAITLQILAPIAGVTPVSFCRSYKRMTGESPIVKLNKLRVAEACRLLRETDLTVKEIAYRCGYQETNFFYHLFKREIGLTPLEFRKVKR